MDALEHLDEFPVRSKDARSFVMDGLRALLLKRALANGPPAGQT